MPMKARACFDAGYELSNRNQMYQYGSTIPSPATEGAEWSVICITGYRWLDANVKFIICPDVGNWSIPTSCSRRENSISN